jgi:hypothetical protein
MVNVTAEPSGPLAVENHQLGQSGIANRLLVIRDSPLGLSDRGVLPPEQVKPKPPINVHDDFAVNSAFAERVFLGLCHVSPADGR